MRRLLHRLARLRPYWLTGLHRDLAGPPNRHRLGITGQRARDNHDAHGPSIANGDEW